ncbi:kinase-like protein [Aspergillus eucalypticola CBS 122712]|uniref:Kinase-like protein n=1 Tax=Aspergillus eucalypticola (strain CBS 122712 / IBT 29274) TaxID=1448314 RepID=A0A317ULV9_ASPEC|nr:kinase-like protein [Aspergillus eucalypticola CBS 122712]PWY62874.1 kinase-like protein [Aspergillus eucalypticola CBS 122712]
MASLHWLDYTTERNSEPISRSQTSIYYIEGNKWWIRVTLLGPTANLPFDNAGEQQTTKRERREFFQSFVRRIDYKLLPLLPHTVTEIILGDATATGVEVELQLDDASGTSQNPTTALRCNIQEDFRSVAYPSCDEFPSFRQINHKELTGATEITAGVFWVYHRKTRYVLKIVDRPLYRRHDTEVIRKELENLNYFAGVPNIVQAAGIAVSTNPYKTFDWDTGLPLVVTGILLEAYPGGTLQQVLSDLRVTEYRWKQWPVQIGTALIRLHETKKTHMDLNPSNIVLDADGNAVLIDISGIGGFTHEWCAPEVLGDIPPCNLSFEQRQQNDNWAYGKLLSEIASQISDDPHVETLRQVADGLMERDLRKRTSITTAIAQLQSA